MAAQLNDAAKRLLDQPFLCNLATLMADGSPQVTPVWVEYDGRYITVNTAEGRQKAVNLHRDPRVALDIVDPQDPYNVLSVRGRIVGITHEGADEQIDRLAKKYLGQEKYPFRRPDEQRVTLQIEPTHVLMQPNEG